MQKVSYIFTFIYTFGKYFGRWPFAKNVKKSWIFDRRGGCQVTVFDNFILASTAHERITVGYLVS